MGRVPLQQKVTPCWTPPHLHSVPFLDIPSNDNCMVGIAVVNSFSIEIPLHLQASPKRQGSFLASSDWKMAHAQQREICPQFDHSGKALYLRSCVCMVSSHTYNQKPRNQHKHMCRMPHFIWLDLADQTCQLP
jgi:hypothetical protein